LMASWLMRTQCGLSSEKNAVRAGFGGAGGSDEPSGGATAPSMFELEPRESQGRALCCLSLLRAAAVEIIEQILHNLLRSCHK
jgi:hypothetical protein